MLEKFSFPFKRIVIQQQDVVVFEAQNYKIFLLGTNHISEQSRKAAEKLVNLVRPQIVAVELCLDRLENANIFNDREKYEKKYHDLRLLPFSERRKAVGEITRLILAYQALEHEKIKQFTPKYVYKVKPIYIDEHLTIAGDVFTPFKNFTWNLRTNGLNYLSSSRASYKIVLADRPMNITYDKLAKAFNDEEKTIVRVYKKDFVSMFFDNEFGVMKQIWKRNRKVKKIMIRERDKYLAETILKATQLPEISGVNTKIVAIVGRAHINGILAEWVSRFQINT